MELESKLQKKLIWAKYGSLIIANSHETAYQIRIELLIRLKHVGSVYAAVIE